MWRKYLLYFLLINILNTAFFPGENLDDNPLDGLEEVGQEEFNTIVEYLIEDLLGHVDQTPEDEDDDAPDTVKFEKQVDPFYLSCFKMEFTPIKESIVYSSFYLSRANIFCLEIHAPPPKI